ncbi:MAG: hypothetical protein AAGC60_07305 [Acidobacteriota bacterium]
MDQRADLSRQPVSLGHYTYQGHGSVNTHWIETETGLVVIDCQRDTVHAAEALAAELRREPSVRESAG